MSDLWERLEAGGSASRYAEVEYRFGNLPRRRIARLPADGPDLHVGDRIHVNVHDCSAPVARPP